MLKIRRYVFEISACMKSYPVKERGYICALNSRPRPSESSLMVKGLATSHIVSKGIIWLIDWIRDPRMRNSQIKFPAINTLY